MATASTALAAYKPRPPVVESPTSRTYDGKAMAALNDQQRLFVQAMVHSGVNPKAAQKCAIEAGYADKMYGYQLMRNEGILAALREEATKRLVGGSLVGVNVMMEIATSPGHKDQYKAARDLAAINGFTAEQRIVVEHINEDTKGQMNQIREMAQQLGLDPKQLIAAAGIIEVEGEFTEVKEAEVDTSDW